MKLIAKLVFLMFLALSLHSNELKKIDETKVLKEFGFIDSNYPNERLNWNSAKRYCENINGRLPSITEFKEIYKIVGKKSKYFKGEWYWASDETEWRHKNGAYRFNFYDGRDGLNVKDATYYIRCIKEN